MFIRLVQYWVLLCSSLSFAGWFLSYFRLLNSTGYFFFFLGAGAVFVIFFRPVFAWPTLAWRGELHKLRRRSRRLAPALYFLTLVLSILGGLLYEPLNGDAQAYRIPRVLHWLAENQWHWIHTGDNRMNVVAPGTEWLWAPGFFFFKGQRWLFLYNAISFTLLPGLVYAFLTTTGVRKRIAWWWMWLLPSAYGYAMQAGSIANDSYSAVFSLASVVFALKARRSQKVSDLWISLLAAALMTGTKQTNILLLPLWFVPFSLNWKLLLPRPILGAVILVFAIGVSCVPITYLNLKFAGSWQGFGATKVEPKSPFWGVVGNAFALTAQNILPPAFPWAPKWNAAMDRFLTTPFGSHFQGFEEFGHLYRAPSEGNAGLGLALFSLLIWALLARDRNDEIAANLYVQNYKFLYLTFFWAPWLLLLIFMAKIGIGTNTRYLAPMYPFLLPIILFRVKNQYRLRTWRYLAFGTMLLTVLLLITSRQRPLFPVQTVCSAGQKLWPKQSIWEKIQNSYSYFQTHSKIMRQLAASFPKDQTVGGYAAEVGFFENCLWLPFGSKRIYRFIGEDGPEVIKGKGVSYVVLEETVIKSSGARSIEHWLEKFNAKILLSIPFRRLGPEAPIETVYLIKME
jgi:hypothetical protein